MGAENDPGEPSRFEVRSADGTPIAVWAGDERPPVVLVHGSIQDHSGQDALADELRTDFGVYSMDRRGFGASGDAPEYSIEREFEDVAAVVDAVASRTEQAVALWGHSYGANCAMGGAALTRNIRRLILYEPSLGLTYPPGAIESVEAALARGDNEAALVLVLATIGMTDTEIDEMRSTAQWPSRVATAPTVPRECRAEESWVHQPGQFDAISAPTLLLSGSESPSVVKQATERAVASIARCQTRILEGHAHVAHKTDPAFVAAIVKEFVAE